MHIHRGKKYKVGPLITQNHSANKLIKCVFGFVLFGSSFSLFAYVQVFKTFHFQFTTKPSAKTVLLYMQLFFGQSSATNLVVTQYLFIGYEFWQIHHWITFSPCLKNFKKIKDH